MTSRFKNFFEEKEIYSSYRQSKSHVQIGRKTIKATLSIS